MPIQLPLPKSRLALLAMASLSALLILAGVFFAAKTLSTPHVFASVEASTPTATAMASPTTATTAPTPTTTAAPVATAMTTTTTTASTATEYTGPQKYAACRMLPERAVVDLLGIRLSSIEGAAFAPGQGDECFYQYATVNGATFQLRSQAYCITEGQSNQSALAYWDTTKRRSEPLTSSVKGARVYTQVTEFYPETVVAAATAQCVIEIGMPVADAPNAPPVNGGPDTVLVRALELAYNNFVNQNMTPAE